MNSAKRERVGCSLKRVTWDGFENLNYMRNVSTSDQVRMTEKMSATTAPV